MARQGLAQGAANPLLVVPGAPGLDGGPAGDAPSGSVWGEQRALTAGLLMAVTLVAFEALAVATILPEAQRDLGGLRLYGWAFSGFLLASLVGIVWSGELCDRAGPAPPLAAGLILFGVGLLVAGLAPGMGVLVAGRVVQGLGAGSVPAVAYVAISRGYGEHQRPRLLALMSTAWVVPGLAGPGIAGVVAEATDWRFVFLGLLPLLGLAGWLTLPALRGLGPPQVPAERDGVRTWRALQLAGGTALLLAGATSGSIVAGIPLAVAGAVAALDALRRLLPAGSLRAARGLPSAVVGIGVLNLAFFGADAYIPYSLANLRDQPTWVVGMVLTLVTLSWTAGAWLVVHLGTRVSRSTLRAAGMLIIAAGIGGVAVALAPDAPVVLLTSVAWTIGGFGMGIAYSCFSLAALAQLPPGEEGVAGSALKLSESLGAAVGAGIGGALIAAGEAAGRDVEGAVATFVVMAVVAVAGVGLSARSEPG